MKRYETYKESGVEWIGEIPEGWSIVPLKHNLSLKGRIGWNGLKSDEFQKESYAYLVTDQDFNSDIVNWDKCYQIDKVRYDEDPFIQLENGDLLVTKDGTIGKVAKVVNLDKPACLNSGIFVVKQTKDVFEQNYLYWLLVSNQLKEFVGFNSTGSTIQHLYQNVFENMPLTIPSISEQQAISNYLDRKVGQIDASISSINAQIDDLKAYRQSVISEAVTKGIDKNVKMKHSGVEWIGEIPEGWIIVRLRYLLEEPLMYGASESGDTDHPEHPRNIRITDIAENGKLKDIGAKYLAPELAEPYMLKKKDILFARSGATVGKTYLFDEDIDACFAGYLIKATCTEKIIPEYLFKYTQSGVYENWKNSMLTQATIQNIGADKYNELAVTVPSKSEQQAIVTYLDEKTSKIDISIKALVVQRDDLNALKQSIISETVTGKIDVRDWNKNSEKK